MSTKRKFEDFPRPSLAVDPAVLTVKDGELHCLLWKRSAEPDAGRWALPGVFVQQNEGLEDAVGRAVLAKLGLDSVPAVEQLLTWNVPGRDVRGWVVTVAYYALVPFRLADEAASRRPDVALFRMEVLPNFDDGDKPVLLRDAENRLETPAFDHQAILGAVLRRIRRSLWSSCLALELLPPTFTLRELQGVYEAILGRSLNKDSFRRRVVKTQGLVAPVGVLEEDVDHRPAELYEATRTATSVR